MAGLKAPAQGERKNKFPRPPNLEEGGYPGRVVRVLDLGRQPGGSWDGKAKAPQHEIYVTYELADEFLPDENGEPDETKPRWVSEKLPLHPLAADLAKSTKRAKALDPDNETEGDWSLMLGRAGLIGIVRKKDKKNEGVFHDNVGSVGRLRDKDLKNLPELVNPPVIFSLEDPDMEVFNKLPQWIKDLIQNNLDYKGSPLAKLLGDAPAKAPAAQEEDEPEQFEDVPELGGAKEDEPSPW